MAGDNYGEPKTKTIPHYLKSGMLSNEMIAGPLDIVFEDDAVAGTIVTLNGLVKPDILRRVYMICVENPSEESELEITPLVISGESSFALGTFECPVAVSGTLQLALKKGKVGNVPSVIKGSIAKLVHGLYFADGSAISIATKKAITTGFTARLWIFEAD